MELVEKLARELCKAAAVDPDQVGGAWDGGPLPRSKSAWTAWEGLAELAIDIVMNHEGPISQGVSNAIPTLREALKLVYDTLSKKSDGTR